MQRFGEAVTLGADHAALRRARRFARNRLRGALARRRGSESGFTLIELVIVVAILPLVIGAIAIGLISVLSLNSGVSSSLTDSSDAQVVSANFQNDVQSASMFTTYSQSTSPSACGTGYQVLGLQLGDGTVISYAVTQEGTAYTLFRNQCSGTGTLTESNAVAHDMPSSVLNAASPPVSVTCVTPTAPATNACSGTSAAYESNWEPTTGVTGITFSAEEPGSSYAYTLDAVPTSSGNSTALQAPANTLSGSGFALPGTGTYASSLSFVDFSGWNTQTSAAKTNCATGSVGISNDITNTPYILSMCMSVTGYSSWNSGWTTPSSLNGSCGGSGTALTGNMSGGGSDNPTNFLQPRSGYDDIAATPLPTYADPPGSEAFLGDNGFYTGVSGNPALYEINEGSCAVIKLTSIELTNQSYTPETNWQLVTGDAESTDSTESIVWSSNQDLSLLDNSANSPVGNSCDSTAPGTNSTYLTGLGTTTVQCSSPSSFSADHTGAVMLEADQPTSLTIQLFGGGLQAAFVGVLLAS